MSTKDFILTSNPMDPASAKFRPAPGRLHRWLSAPLHDYPLREEILFQYSGLPALIRTDSCRPRVLEAGPGAGFAAHFLSDRTCLALADMSPRVLADLESHLAGTGVETWPIDLGKAGDEVPPSFLGQFDFVFSLDMFQFIADASVCLRRFAELLHPGGELFLTFPNQASQRAGHVCWFERVDDLAALLRSEGFARATIFATSMRGWARALYTAGHDAPLSFARRLRGTAPITNSAYDRTWAASQSGVHPLLRWSLHGWWSVLARLLSLGGPRFATEPIVGPARGHRLVVRAWK